MKTVFAFIVLLAIVAGCGNQSPTAPTTITQITRDTVYIQQPAAPEVIIHCRAYMLAGTTICFYQDLNTIYTYNFFCGSCATGGGNYCYLNFRCNPTDTVTAIYKGLPHCRMPSDTGEWDISG